MNLSLLMTVNTIITTVFGIALVIAPDQTASLYGVDVDAHYRQAVRLYGSELLGFAVLTWVTRNSPDSDARQAIVLALYLLPALGFGYFQFWRTSIPSG